jgi:DNA-binding response OmpR family regulator
MAKVLVVEDDQDIRALVQLRLRAAGHLVVSAESAEEALELIGSRGAPEVLVSDVSLPGLSGLDLVRRLRDGDRCPGVPVVLLSGRVQPADIAAGQELGATYLTKPVIISALCAAVERVLASSTAGSW